MPPEPEEVVEQTLSDRMDTLLRRWIDDGPDVTAEQEATSAAQRHALASLAREALTAVAHGDLRGLDRWLAAWRPNGLTEGRALVHIQLLRRRIRRDLTAQLTSPGQARPALADTCEALVDDRFDAVIRRLFEARVRHAAAELPTAGRDLLDLAAVVKDPLYSLSADGTFRYVSPAIEDLTGHPAQAFLDDPDLWSRLVVEEDRGLRAGHLEAVLEGRVPAQVTYRVRPHGGEAPRYVMDRSSPVLEGGVLARVDGVLIDITERVELELRLERTETLRSLGQLARDVAHDFNNLLVSILGHADLLMDRLPEGTDEARKLQLIASAAEQGARLTERLLGFARGSTHARRREPVQPVEVVADSVELARASIPPSLRLETRLRADTPTVDAARGRLDEAVLNLVLNAAHACDGGEGSRITVESRPATPEEASRIAARRGAIIEVRDDGPGMTEEVRSRVFEPLFTTRAGQGGSGLGCAIAYGVAVDHGGLIEVDSAPGRGATFRMLLPAAATTRRQHASAPPRDPGPADDAEGGERDAPGRSGRSARILVVDDEPSVRQLLQDLLEGAGYHISSATSGQEAIDAVLGAPDRYALVILDVMMHPVDGTEAFARIREALPELPIVFCTGHSDAQRIAVPDALSSAPVVRKPFRAAHLIRVVREAIEAIES